jgi:hypothetical protein
MDEESKAKITSKWDAVLNKMSNTKRNWLAEYAEAHGRTAIPHPYPEGLPIPTPTPNPSAIRNPFGSIFFPTAMKVATQTIGMDLVSVQPMAAPTGTLYYMGTHVVSDEVRREKIRRVMIEWRKGSISDMSDADDLN